MDFNKHSSITLHWNVGGGRLARVGGGMAGSPRPAMNSKENMLCVIEARVMGVSMVIAAWGEGVNVCLCPPSPSSDRLSFAQNVRKNAGWCLGSWGKYVVGARVMSASMVIAAWGEGINVFSPLVESLIVRPKRT